ncbi:hypothetical protein [Mucilaginibacter sp. PAMB04168]|uniref:hypothetical protein n=1 Tax=Mucilaginibacter sp. PAMB04168 TaxID=3138567 RepID=UPI0031F6BDE3
MRISAAVVVYNPDISELIYNIKSYINVVDKVIVWQNTLVDQIQLRNSFVDVFDKIVFLGNGRNVGIGAGLNGAVKWSINNSYTHILTLDQDSCFESKYLTFYLDTINKNTDQSIGIFGVNPLCHAELVFSQSTHLLDVTDTITSGSVFPLEVFEKCGYFNEDMFIDAVDYEFCYRAKKYNGLKTVIITNAVMTHEVGYSKKTVWGFSTVNYSSFRTYYIVRNQTLIWRQYPEYFSYQYKKTLIMQHIIFRAIKIIMAESDKFEKIKSIFKGIKDGLFGKLLFSVKIHN